MRATSQPDSINCLDREGDLRERYILAAALLAAFCGAVRAQDAMPAGTNGNAAPGKAVAGEAVEGEAAVGAAALNLPTITVEGRFAGVTGFVPDDSATAMKTDVPLVETPASVSVVGAAEIAGRGGATNVGEAISYVPGVFVPPAFTVNSDATQIRGFWAVNYLDGLRIGSGTKRSGQFSIETYGLERIDVLRGPASVLYGQMAPGGIVNEVSKRPHFDDTRESLVRFGSYGLMQGAFDINGVVGDGDALGWRLVAFGQSAGTQMDGVDDDRLYLAPSLTWNIGDKTSLTLLPSYRRLRGADWQNDGVAEALEIVSPGFNPGEPGWDRRNSDQYAIGYEFVHEFAPTLRFVNNLRYTHTDIDYRQVLAWNGLTGNPDRPFEVGREAVIHDQDVSVFDTDARLEWDTATGPVAHRVMVGVDYSDNYADWNGEWADAQPLDFADPVHSTDFGPFTAFRQRNWTTETGVYVQDVATFDRWHATVGGRWTEAELKYRDSDPGRNYDEKDRAFVGNIGLLYLTPSGIAPYVSFSQSYEPQVGADWQGHAFEPTRGDQYEVGVKYQPPGIDALLTVAAFQITQSNLTTTDPDHPDFARQTGEVRVRGVEFEGRTAVGPVDVSLAYTHLDSEITRSSDGVEGNDYTTVPDVASLWVQYEAEAGPVAGLSLGAGVRYGSESWADEANTVRRPSTLVVDLAAGYDFGAANPRWEGVSLQLNANNLGASDDIYCEAWGCYFTEQPTVSASLTYRF